MAVYPFYMSTANIKPSRYIPPWSAAQLALHISACFKDKQQYAILTYRPRLALQWHG